MVQIKRLALNHAVMASTSWLRCVYKSNFFSKDFTTTKVLRKQDFCLLAKRPFIFPFGMIFGK